MQLNAAAAHFIPAPNQMNVAAAEVISNPNWAFGPSTTANGGTNLSINQRLLKLSSTPTDSGQVGKGPSLTLDCAGQKMLEYQLPDSCFRPIISLKVKAANGQSLDTYGLIDNGSNRSVISISLNKFGRQTIDASSDV